MVGLTGRNTILRKICVEASPASRELYGAKENGQEGQNRLSVLGLLTSV